ncbi:MAG: hypothetical protein AABZ60_12065 [Planctomycetota bacterium]
MKYSIFGYYFLGSLIHLVFLCSLYGGWLNPFFCDSTHRAGQASDFFTHYQASYNYWQGKSLYKKLTDQPDKVVPYCYREFRFFPSSAFLVGGLITLFSPWNAYIFWIILNELLLGFMLVYVWKLCPARFHYAFLLTLGFTPYYVELYMGQFNFVVAFSLFFLGYAFLKKSRLLLAFSFYGTLFIKYYGIIFLPLFLWKRQIFVLFGFFLGMILAFGPYFMKYPEDLALLRETHAIGGSHAGNLGMRAFLYVCGDLLTQTRIPRQLPNYTLSEPVDPQSRPFVSRFLYDYLWIFCFVLLCWRTIHGDQQFLILLTLWTLFFFLLSKDVWEHHYVVLIPIFCLLNAQYDLTWRKWCFFFIAIPTPFWGLDVSIPIANIDPEPYWTGAEVLIYHSAKILPTLVLFFSLLFSKSNLIASD